QKTLIQAVHFLKRIEMNLNFSFAATLVNRDLRTQGLFESVNCSLNVRILGFGRNSVFLYTTIPGVTRHYHLGLPNGVVSLDNFSGGVEYGIQVRKRQECFGMTGRESIFPQPLLNFRREAQKPQHIRDRRPILSDAPRNVFLGEAE